MSKINKIKVNNVEYDIEDSTVDTKLANKQDKLNEGANISIDENTNTITATDTKYTAKNDTVNIDSDYKISVPIASDTNLGVVKEGNNITIDDDGTINATGGSGGTTNYNDLSNRPYINGELLENSKESSDYGLAKEKHTHNITDVTNLKSSLDDINNKIPSDASGSNQLADKSFVNNSISSATSDMQVVSNKTTSLSGTGDDIHYPTTKAVIDYHDSTKADNSTVTEHIGDSTHIQTGERDTWNSKAEGSHTHDTRYYTETEMDSKLNNKQDTLINGTNIKTVQGRSLLGSGDVSILESQLTRRSFTVLNETISGSLSGSTVFIDGYYDFTSETDQAYIDGITIDKNLTIIGVDCTIDAHDLARAFNITNYASVTFKNIKFTRCKSQNDGNGGAIYSLTGGDITLINCEFSKCSSNQLGGAIVGKISDSIDCSFIDCSCTGSGSRMGGAIYSLGVNGTNLINNLFYNCSSTTGGAIFSMHKLYVENSSFTRCESGSGGAISAEEIEINNSSFNNCSASGGGGGAIEADGGTLDDFDSWISDCTFVNNESAYGGAIYIGSADYISDCNFINNDATSDESDAIYLTGSCDICDCKFDDVGYTSIVGSNASVVNCGFLNTSGTSPWIANGSNCYDDSSSYLVTNTTLQTGLNGKSDTTHTHDTWVDKSSELGSITLDGFTGSTHSLHINESIRLANYQLNVIIGKIKTTTKDTTNALGSGVIPTDYRPTTVVGSPYYGWGNLNINSLGNVSYRCLYAKTSTTATQNLYYNLIWRY